MLAKAQARLPRSLAAHLLKKERPPEMIQRALRIIAGVVSRAPLG